MVTNSTADQDELTLLAEEFHLLGFSIINKPSIGSLNTQFRQFKGFFGLDWMVCAKLWLLLMPLLCDENYNACGAKPKHLLWMLMFLKLYDTEDILSSNVGGVDEKTYRKWVWQLIDLVSYLEIDMVSCCLVIIFSLLLINTNKAAMFLAHDITILFNHKKYFTFSYLF